MFVKPIIVGGESPITPTPPTPYVRPADWLEIPESTGEYDDIYILRGVGKGENPFAIQVSASASAEITLDYGDGMVETLTGETSYTKRHNYDYDSTPDSAWTEHNRTKQVLIHIRASRGAITNVNFRATRYWEDGTSVSIYVSNLIYEINGNIEEANVDVSNSGNYYEFQDMEIFNLIYKELGESKTYMFNNCRSLQKVGLFDTSSVRNMNYMFAGCYSLQTIPQLDTSRGAYMSNMFQNCNSLQSIPLLDTSKVVHMQYMFQGCDALQTIPLLNTSSVTSMNNMFYNCPSLQTIPQFDTSSVTSMQSMFSSCYSLQSIPQFDTSSVTSMQSMFSSCYSLQSIPQFDTSSVTSMSNMFYYCYSLQSIPQLDTSNVTNMYNMFYNCSSLQTIPQFDTSNVTNMGGMVNTCYSLQSIPQFDTSSTSMSGMFNDCYSLQKAILYNAGAFTQSGILISDLTDATLFTAQTLIDLFNSLASNVNALTRNIRIGYTNQNKLANVYVAPTSEEHYYILATSDTEIDATKTYYTYNEITDEYTQVTPDFSSDEFYFEKVISAETKYAIVEAGTDGAMLALDWVTNVKGWTVS